MIRILAPAAALAAALSLAGAASAQTYGQPVYLDSYGRPVGGSPLSEVETRSYVETGRWAGGYSDQPHVYVPGSGYGQTYGAAHGYGRHDPGRYGHGYGSRSGHGYDRGYGRYGRPSQGGYRDEWGYNDDRPPSARGWSEDRRSYREDRDCGCGDVYLYDR